MFLLLTLKCKCLLRCEVIHDGFKTLQLIRQNWLKHHLQVPFNKQFGFQLNNSTEHILLQLINEIKNSFGNSEFIFDLFIDLSKAFNTANHDILLIELKYYDINGFKAVQLAVGNA